MGQHRGGGKEETQAEADTEEESGPDGAGRPMSVGDLGGQLPFLKPVSN